MKKEFDTKKHFTIKNEVGVKDLSMKEESEGKEISIKEKSCPYTNKLRSHRIIHNKALSKLLLTEAEDTESEKQCRICSSKTIMLDQYPE